MQSPVRTPGEGEIYKILTVGGKTFTLKYGYYSENERKLGIPIPVLPDFRLEPLYDSDGLPFVTRIQDACEHYEPCRSKEGDGWCADCRFYPNERDDIGICQCEHNKR